MGFGDLQIYDLIIFAGVAAFLIYRLRNVLGKRTGFEKNYSKKPAPEIQKSKEEIQQQNIPELDANINKLKIAYENLEEFDHKKFIEGAKLAYETIINSFNNRDKKTLKMLLTQEVYLIFEKEINKKNINTDSQFFSLNIEKIENVIIESGVIKISIKFISEQYTNNDETTVVKNQDVWTFEKPINSKNPNWFLSST